ncbi:MAG: OmpA family protein [Desulfobacterales bacterium]|nr:MAG: OmpA family protein [Desulfobacterales bacterium]
MVKNCLKISLFLLIGGSLISCAAYRPQLLQPEFQPAELDSKLQSGDIQQKVDNFMAVLDASGSKEETYRGHSKFAIAQDFLHRMNQTIPEVSLTGGLRSFGHSGWPFAQKTTLVYGPTAYSKEGFQAALEQVKWGGGLSPADLALDAASDDLASVSGRTAVILVGDGEYAGYDPAGAAQRLKARYGDDLCIYTVLVGSEDPASIRTMEDIANAGECGFYQSAKYLDTPQAMAAWVEQVFFAKVERPAEAPPPPPAADSDGDGITDDMDQCPNTPLGAPVNNMGCWIIENVEFDFDKSVIKPEFQATLDQIAEVMQQNPDLTIEIGGHTDNIGAEPYNLMLSERRAAAAKQYLLDKGIASDRISIQGFGLSMPTTTNDTEWGRTRNRRDEFQPSRN